MATFFYNQIIPPDETERPGMKELYADKSEASNIRYVNDIVYAEKSGMKLHLQMLYPDIPIQLMQWQMEQRMKASGYSRHNTYYHHR